MNTRRYRQYITNAYTLAHNGVQTAIQTGRQVANNYAEQEARGIEMWRYICEQAYPYNERLRNELYEYGINHYKQILQGIGLAAATASRQSINYVQQHFQQMISTGMSQISNNPFQHALNWASEGIQNVGQGIDNMARTSNQRILNRAWQAYRRPTHDVGDQTFLEFLRNQGNQMSEQYVNSFLNSLGVAQDSMARGANFREIVTAPNGQIVPNNNGNSPGLGALAGGFNQGMTQTTTTANPTTTSQTPTTTTTTPMERATGTGPTSGSQHGETGVEMINYSKFHPYKRVEQVLMPWYRSSGLNLGREATSASAITFRLNSIYDISHAAAAFNNNTTPAADTADAASSIEVPAMREYWSKAYNYWHVIKCEWKFKFRPSTTGGLMKVDDNNKYRLFFYEHGRQYPPVSQTIGGTTTFIPTYIRKYHPHVRTILIDNKLKENQGMSENAGDRFQIMTGTWMPGDIQHEVAEDQFTQVWHKWTEVPPTAEKLTILLQPEDGFPTAIASNGTDQYRISYSMEMVYTVQLKDLKTEFEFITQATGIAATTNIANLQTL